MSWLMWCVVGPIVAPLVLVFLCLFYSVAVKPLFRHCYEMGMCNGRVARRIRGTNRVQFILWAAGEQGHKEDFWCDFGVGHEEHFIPGEPKVRRL